MLRILQKSLFYHKILTKQQAFHRQNIIKNQSIQYSFHINLNPGKIYNGLMQMKFDFNNSQILQNTNLDFQGKNIHKLYVNGQKIQNFQYNTENGKISIPKEYLNEKENYISINYQCQYDMDGNGCISFTDVDQKQYLYTQFQPYMANRVFPIFDQPDLKAKMKLAISYPEEWQTAISNQPIQQQIKIQTLDRNLFQIHSKFMRPIVTQKYLKMRQHTLKQYYDRIPINYKLTSFKQTSLLPSYLYCFVVGPYKKFVCHNTYKNIPMNLYCIQSLQRYLKELRPYIQQMTNKSFQFFQGYFRHSYPFSKYDQVFAHEYKWGAMQNTGIVTLNDLYLFKDRVSNQKMLSFGNTIIHQLAHHWFGNLVTMKWWDDLWLNESFAQYISHFCLEKIKKEIKTLDYQNAMLSFYIRKGWGYMEDELVTTHPITGQVTNTHMAQSIFDGITYSKGAAVMKQLMYLIGEQNFSKALGEYFNKYAFKNTQLDDLLHCIQKYFPDMANWKQMWLQKAGVNILSCQWKKQSKEIKIKQTYVREQHKTLRIHMINIAYVEKSGKIHKQQLMIKNIPEKKIQIPNNIKPQAIVLNYQDLTFCKISIDPISFQYFQKNLNLIQDSLLRAMIWRTLFEMVRDSRMLTSQYLSFIVNNLRSQNSDTIIEEQLGNLHTCITQYIPLKYRTELFTKIYQYVKNYLIVIDEKQINRITILKDKLIAFANSQKQKEEIFYWFSNDKLPELNHTKIHLNITQKWKAIIKFLNSKNIKKEQKIKSFQKQANLDNSDTMHKKKLTCDILIQENQFNLLNIYEKLKKMQNFLGTSPYTYTIQGLNSQIHKSLIKFKIQNKYLIDLKYMLEETTPYQKEIDLKDDYKQIFMSQMDPIINDNLEDLQNKRLKYEQIKPKNDKLRIMLLKKVDELKRRQKCYKYFEQNYRK